ncbi:MAG: hypothetical protein EXX96DRAFT_555619 [Benjaminiella poitrasii]|nr:MAG: hypothetical protein EXX96DRAFT_555619 [Benjaminiella poitrasii]
MFTISHAIWCLHMHRRLQMPLTESDPLSFFLKKLSPSTKCRKLDSSVARSTLTAFSVWMI